MNKRILELFQEFPEAYVSGEEISRRLNVSRTAIWKHIEELRSAGYEFEAAPRKGYRLLSKPNSWQVNELLSGLKTKVLGQKNPCLRGSRIYSDDCTLSHRIRCS
jgi:BirA family biotin operon repressor/biotin-[acetyl-CoA-carboxylase] ligase